MVEVAHPVPWQAQLRGCLTVQAHLLQGLQWGSGQLPGLCIQPLALRSMGSIDRGGCWLLTKRHEAGGRNAPSLFVSLVCTGAYNMRVVALLPSRTACRVAQAELLLA